MFLCFIQCIFLSLKRLKKYFDGLFRFSCGAKKKWGAKKINIDLSTTWSLKYTHLIFMSCRPHTHTRTRSFFCWLESWRVSFVVCFFTFLFVRNILYRGIKLKQVLVVSRWCRIAWSLRTLATSKNQDGFAFSLVPNYLRSKYFGNFEESRRLCFLVAGVELPEV